MFYSILQCSQNISITLILFCTCSSKSPINHIFNIYHHSFCCYLLVSLVVWSLLSSTFLRKSLGNSILFLHIGICDLYNGSLTGYKILASYLLSTIIVTPLTCYIALLSKCFWFSFISHLVFMSGCPKSVFSLESSIL